MEIILLIISTVLLKLPIRNMVPSLVKYIYFCTNLSIGFFENGRRHGEGTFTYENGDTYSGWWKYGVKCGQGTYIYKNSGMRVSYQQIFSYSFLAFWYLGK